ncbi:MAG: hypothetical protein WCG27_01355 [Pseudomonadota bacterium]
MISRLLFSVSTLLFLAGLIGCSFLSPQSQVRSPSSEGGEIDMLSQVDNFIKRLPEINEVNCAKELAPLFQKAFHLDPSKVDREVLDNPQLIHQAFLARLALRENFRQWDEKAKHHLSAQCVKANRDIHRALRFMEEYVAEYQVKPAPFDDTARPLPVPLLPASAIATANSVTSPWPMSILRAKKLTLWKRISKWVILPVRWMSI